MHLIQAVPVPTPADAERLIADLWQMTSGRPLGLYMFGMHGRGMSLGVHCSSPYVEDLAASTISDHIGGQVEPGWAITQMIDVADEVAVINMVPTDRNLAITSTTFGWQRTDPLRGAFSALTNTPAQSMAGVGLTLRSMPNLRFLVSMAAFAVGPGAGPLAVRIATSFAGVGIRLRRPFMQRRAIQRTLNASLRRPASVKRIEEVTHYWHPPYGSDVLLPGVAQAGGAPAGFLDSAPPDH
jgi:hypothetical protein